MKGRLSDSNKNHIMTTLGIIGTLASSMGSGCLKYAKTFIPPTLGNLGDSKVSLSNYMYGDNTTRFNSDRGICVYLILSIMLKKSGSIAWLGRGGIHTCIYTYYIL